MSPNEIAYWYSIGNLGSFSTALFELFMKADNTNKEKLGSVYPEYYEAYQLWFHKPDGWNNIHNNKEK